MSKAAVFSADYYNFEYKKGLKVCRLVFEVPYEHAGLVRDVLGDPPLGGAQVRVAIARLQDAPLGATENGPKVEASNPPVTPHADQGQASDKPRTFSSLPRSQQAGMKIKEPAFQAWLGVDTDDFKDRVEAEADAELKRRLAILSKTELDTEGPKSLAFDRLMTDFSVRGIIR